MHGGRREGAGRAAIGRSTEVISLRVSQETKRCYEALTPAQKRSLVRLVSSMARSRAAKRAGLA